MEPSAFELIEEVRNFGGRVVLCSGGCHVVICESDGVPRPLVEEVLIGRHDDIRALLVEHVPQEPTASDVVEAAEYVLWRERSRH